MLQMSFFVDRY